MNLKSRTTAPPKTSAEAIAALRSEPFVGLEIGRLAVGVSRSTFYTLARRDLLPVIRLGSRVLLNSARFLELLGLGDEKAT